MPRRTSDQLLQMLVDAELLKDEDATDLTQELESYEDLKQKLVERKIVSQQQLDALDEGDLESLVIGQYRIEEILGAGGMGVVFRATHLTLNREVALKVVSRPVGKESPELNEIRVQRFRREAALLARLQHPNIAMAYDASCDHGIHYLAMEFIGGEDLTQRVRHHGVFNIPAAISVVYQAAMGLSYAHQNGIIHRDVKPSNLILNEQGVVKVLDCGLAKIIHSVAELENTETAVELTYSGAVVGTASYMSPEQAENTRSADERSDIYSLGCTLWYLLTGQAVYEGDSALQTLLHHREHPIPQLGEILDETDAELQTILDRMLAKVPADRYQSMAEVAEALKGYYQSCIDESGIPSLAVADTSWHSPSRKVPLADSGKEITRVAEPVTDASGTGLSFSQGLKPAPGTSSDLRSWRWVLLVFCLLIAIPGLYYLGTMSNKDAVAVSEVKKAEQQSAGQVTKPPEPLGEQILETFDVWSEGQSQIKLIAPTSRQASSRSRVKLPDHYRLEVEMIRSGAPQAEYDLAGTTHFELRIGDHFFEFYLNNGGDLPIKDPSNGFLFLNGIPFAHRREQSTSDIVKERWLREHEVDRIVFEVHADKKLGTGEVILTINDVEQYRWSGELSTFVTISDRFDGNSYQWDLILNQWNGTCVVQSVRLQDLENQH